MLKIKTSSYIYHRTKKLINLVVKYLNHKRYHLTSKVFYVNTWKVSLRDNHWSVNALSFLSFYTSQNTVRARHHNPLLIRNHSWILTIHKARILRKKLIEKTFLVLKKRVESIQPRVIMSHVQYIKDVFQFNHWTTEFLKG